MAVDVRRSVDGQLFLNSEAMWAAKGPMGAFCYCQIGRIVERFPPTPERPYETHRRDEPYTTCAMVFVCPGCACECYLPFRGVPEYEPKGDAWVWDGNRERPTLSPSIIHSIPKGGCGWHGHLQAGRFNGC